VAPRSRGLGVRRAASEVFLGAYGQLARFVLDHRGPVGALLAMVVLVCAIVGLPPTIEPNLLALLPDDEPAAQALRELHETEGGVNLLTVAVTSDDPEATEAALDDLEARIVALDDVRWAMHEIDPQLAQRIGLLQLDPESVKELSARIQGALLLGPALNGAMAGRLLELGPKAEGIRKAAQLDMFPGMGEGSGRLLVKPTGSAMDPPFAQRFMTDIDGILAEVRASHPDVTIPWVGGAYRHNVEDMRGIQQDILWTSGASFLLVLMVIIVAFRDWRAPVLVFVPLLGANIVNLAFVAVTIGSLNTYTSFGTAILFGLGIDFAVHLVGRTRELVAEGQELEDAIVAAWDRTGPPCMTAALTSAAGFLALAVADFRGFSQLGVLLACGLMLCLFAMLVGLPLLMPSLERSGKRLAGGAEVPHSVNSTYALAPVGLMVAVIVTGMLAVTVVPDLQWEYDFSALRRDGLAYAELSDEERALARDSYTPVVVSYPTEQERRAGEARLRTMLPGLRQIGRVVSIDDIVVPEQGLRLDRLHDLQQQLEHPNARYLPPPLLEQLAPLRGLELGTVRRHDLPEPLLDILGASSPDTHRVLVFPRGNMWDLRQAAALERDIKMGTLPAKAAGEYVTLGALFRHIQADMPKVAGLAMVLVFLLTAIDLRRPLPVFTAVGTLFAGLVWAGTALYLFDVRLTVMNVVGVPILLGIGVDVVIHLLHRLEDEGPGGVRRALYTTGVAASISTLTTVVSFASLTLAGSRGVRSMGMLVVIGLITVFVATAVLLPTAWAAGWRLTGQAPGDPRNG